MRLSQRERIALRCANYSATLSPAAGARITSLVWTRGDLRCPLLVECDGRDFDEHAWPKAGAFPMLPFANRLAPEGFRFGGRMVSPRPGPQGFALHGLAHRRPWNLVDASGRHAQLRLVHDGSEEGWPWAWTAEQEVRLDEGGLHVTLSVRNEARGPMPLAIGWHPYHPVRADGVTEHLEFSAGARRHLDSQGRASSQDSAPVFAMQPGETAAFTRWSGQVRMQSTCEGRIAVRCDGATGLVLHRPASGNYLCVEPVTILPGQLGDDVESAAVGVLRPGDQRRVSWTCSYESGATQT